MGIVIDSLKKWLVDAVTYIWDKQTYIKSGTNCICKPITRSALESCDYLSAVLQFLD